MVACVEEMEEMPAAPGSVFEQKPGLDAFLGAKAADSFSEQSQIESKLDNFSLASSQQMQAPFIQSEDKIWIDPGDVPVEEPPQPLNPACYLGKKRAFISIDSYGVVQISTLARSLHARARAASHTVNTVSVPLAECAAVEVRGFVQSVTKMCGGNDSPSLVLHSFRRRNHDWQPLEICVEFDEERVAAAWAAHIQAHLDVLPERPRRLFVVMNPFGGSRNADNVWADVAKPIFDRARVVCDAFRTGYRDHALELISEMSWEQFSSYDGIIAVGGDGLFQECLRAILAHRRKGGRWRDKAAEVRIAQIPAGSTDAVACTVNGCRSPHTAALHVVLGDRASLDVLEVRTLEGEQRFSCSTTAYGFIADVLERSEALRWMGPARYDFCGVMTFMRLKSYPVRIWYKRPAAPHPRRSVCGSRSGNSCAICLRPGVHHFDSEHADLAALANLTTVAVHPHEHNGCSLPLPSHAANAHTAHNCTRASRTLEVLREMSRSLPGHSRGISGCSSLACHSHTASGGGGFGGGDVYDFNGLPLADFVDSQPPSTSGGALDSAANSVEGCAEGGGSPETDAAWAPPGDVAAAVPRDGRLREVELATLEPGSGASGSAASPNGAGPSRASPSSAPSMPPPPPLSGSETVESSWFSRMRADSVGASLSTIEMDAGPMAPGDNGWRVWEGEISSLMVVVTSTRSDKSKAGIVPHAHMSDGRLHLVIVRKCSRVQFLRFLVGLTRGGVDESLDFVDVKEVEAWRLEPLNEESLRSAWNVDGELTQTRCMSARVHHGLVEVFGRGPEVV